MTETFEFSVPVLVMGGGACGAVAALAAHEAGAEVLVIERDAHPMGTTGMSMGLICAAGTNAQARHGIDDDPGIFFNDIMAKARGQTDPVIARAIADETAPALDWLIETHGFPWDVELGLRPCYGNSRARVHGWTAHGGQDFLDLLHQRLAEAGVPVLTEARVVDLFSDNDGRVLGVEVERPDGAREKVGCETLIVASGGFAANHEMVEHYIPAMAKARNNGHEGSQGDGIRLGERLGAALGDMGAYQGYGMLTEPQGISVSPVIPVEGGMLVNAQGRRFVDETDDISGIAIPLLTQPGDHGWLIYDEAIEKRCADVPEMRMLIELNAARRADTIASLAERIGVDQSVLADTFAQAQAAREAGAPDAFGRDWRDVAVPSGALRALKIVAAIYHTQGGLQIDGEARVLRPDGSPLPNLFAGGGAARSVSGPAGWGYLPAIGLSTAIALGRVAGRAAAGQVLGGEPTSGQLEQFEAGAP